MKEIIRRQQQEKPFCHIGLNGFDESELYAMREYTRNHDKFPTPRKVIKIIEQVAQIERMRAADEALHGRINDQKTKTDNI